MEKEVETMNLKGIREEERRKEIRQRRQKMVQAAFSCFSRQGIENTSIADIAKNAEFGEATLYRYFSNKETLALECGILFWTQAGEYFDEMSEMEDFREKDGFGQVEALALGAMDIFNQDRDGFCLIHNLDRYLLSHKIEDRKMAEYEKTVDSLKPYLCNALEKGKADGSIGRREDTEELYYALANGIFSMMQKQAAAGQILASDLAVAEEKKLGLFLKILLAGLRERLE